MGEEIADGANGANALQVIIAALKVNKHPVPWLGNGGMGLEVND